jgi:hypothetical protein
VIADVTFLSQSDPATAGLDSAEGISATILFAATSLPAFGLALARRAPRSALGLAIAFPAVFAALFIAAVIYFA